MKFRPLPARRALALVLALSTATLPAARADDETDGADPKEEISKETKDAGKKSRSLAKDDDDSAQERYSRETPEMDLTWAPIIDDARRSTVRLLRDGKPIAFATAVSEKGCLITKSSEVHDSKGKELEEISAQFPGGITLAVKITDVHPRFDLALLKVEATGLTPMKWDTGVLPAPGSYVAAVTPERLPAAVGVLSVNPRNLDETHKGFLGISVSSETGKLRISRVGEDSAASEAGLRKDDVVKSINGQAIASVAEFIELIGTRKPYETVKVLVTRGEEDKELTATLRRRPDGFTALAEDARNTMSGPVSRNRSGYPTAFQHDMVLQPNQCGGPVIDLDGKVIGLNIARSGRIECYAIPSATLVSLLEKVDTGKFSRPELDDLRKEVKNAESLLERVKKDAARLKEQLKDAEGG
ncbi:MAG: PDZ domain-containing protein [Verrucomicrobiota bacterium]